MTFFTIINGGRRGGCGMIRALLPAAIPAWLLVYFPDHGPAEYVSTHLSEWQCNRKAGAIPTLHGRLQCLPALEAEE